MDIPRIQHLSWIANAWLHSGKTLSIKAEGNFTEKVEEGAYLVLVVKYGLIRLINQQADLCEQMKSAVDEECPLTGEKTITKDVDLPKEIPPVSIACYLVLRASADPFGILGSLYRVCRCLY